MAQGTKFIRVHGRVVPVRQKTGSGNKTAAKKSTVARSGGGVSTAKFAAVGGVLGAIAGGALIGRSGIGALIGASIGIVGANKRNFLARQNRPSTSPSASTSASVPKKKPGIVISNRKRSAMDQAALVHFLAMRR